MRQTVSGPIAAHHLGSGMWRLTSRAAAGSEIYLFGAPTQAAEWLQDAELLRLSLDWSADAVNVTLIGTQRTHTVSVRGALVHEPRPRLYDGLPLAEFDARAQRFWKRVFRLMRIPGGRRLLGMIARRKSRRDSGQDGADRPGRSRP